MSFISYAQNLEDVMLYRALREVKEGFYIDVGAQDPTIDSVTKAFYERGWRGINIEPNEEYFRKLQHDRPHDVNLQSAVGRETGVISLYEVAHTGLSTESAVYARRHEEAGYEVHLRSNVPCTTLDRICIDRDVQTVHFLKIDVEGSERAVLEGFSFEKVRPWIVVLESTEPRFNREVSAEWEDLLLAGHYQFVYFDGLNRFYVAEEHADLAKHFSCPPNPFDQYVSYHLSWARGELEHGQTAERKALVDSLNHMLAEAESLRSVIAERDWQLETVRNVIAERDRQLEEVRNVTAERDRQLAERDRQFEEVRRTLTATERRLRSIRSSVSWKLTSPLREIRRAVVRIASFVRKLFAGHNAPQEAREGAVDKRTPQEARGGSNFAAAELAVSDEIRAELTEPARSVYRALRERVARKR